MPAQVLQVWNMGGGFWQWALPPTQGASIYAPSVRVQPNGTVRVPTTLEMEKMFKAMQKQIDSLTKEVTRLKAANQKAKTGLKKKR